MKIWGWLLGLAIQAAAVSGMAGAFEQLPVKVVLFPFREVVLSARVDGVIADYRLRTGERFKSGDLLLSLDDQHYCNELTKAEAVLNETSVSADFAKKVMEDNRKLFRQDLQSELEMKRKELEAAIAASRRTIAAANRDEAAMQLNFCKVTAPFEGRIERLFTKEFESVRSGQPLLSIIDDNQLLGVMNLPSNQLGKIKKGDRLAVRIKENGKVITGVVWEIAARADHRSETFQLKILIDNAKHLLNAGMTGILVEKEPEHGK